MPAPTSSLPDDAGHSSRDRIDDAAQRLLAAHGYDGFSLREVADAVGLHKSTLFHHYSGKAELANHVVARAMSRLVELTRARLSGEPALCDFVALSEDIVEHFAAEPDAAKVMLHVVLAPHTSPLHTKMSAEHPLVQLLTLLIGWFDRARRSGAIRWVRIRHTLMDLCGVLLFHPAAALQMPYLAGDAPFSQDERTKRRGEVAAFVKNALAPDVRAIS